MFSRFFNLRANKLFKTPAKNISARSISDPAIMPTRNTMVSSAVTVAGVATTAVVASNTLSFSAGFWFGKRYGENKNRSKPSLDERSHQAPFSPF